MIEINKQKVVIIGHGSTSRLGIVRAVAELGCEISVVVMTWHRHGGAELDTRKPFDSYSKYISHVYYCFAKDGAGLLALLLEKCVDPHQKVILLPDSDFSAAIIDDNQESLSPYFLFPHINHSPGAIRQWMGKDNQKELAIEVGLNVPKSQTVTISEGAFSIPKGISFPCFTKALATINGGKQFFKRCENESELYLQLSTVAQKLQNVSVLVEDYKEIETEYAVLGFSSGKEVIIPGVIRFLKNTVSHFGIAMSGMVVPIAGFEKLINQFKKYVLRLGFIGVFDIDFYFSNGSYYFGEINLRFGGSGYAYTKMGVNLPAMLIRFLRDEDYSRMNKEIERAASYVNERMCEDDWYRDNLTNAEFNRLIKNSDIHFVKDKNDIMPLCVFKMIHFGRFIKKGVKRLQVK